MNIEREKIQEHIYKIQENIFLLGDSVASFRIINDNLDNIVPENKTFFSHIYYQQRERAVLYVGKIFDTDNRTASLCSLLGITKENALDWFCKKEIASILRLKDIRDKHFAHTDQEESKNRFYIWWCDYLRNKADLLLKKYCQEHNYNFIGCYNDCFYSDLVKMVKKNFNVELVDENNCVDFEIQKMQILRGWIFENQKPENNFLFAGKISEKDFVYSVFESAYMEKVSYKIALVDRTDNINWSGQQYVYYKIISGSATLVQPHLSEIYQKLDFANEINLQHVEIEVNRVILSASDDDKKSMAQLIYKSIADYMIIKEKNK